MNKIRDNKNRYRDYVVKLGVFASFLLVTVLSIYFYSPVIKSHATGEADNVAKVELDVDDYLYLTTDKDELNLVGHTNTFVSGQVGIQVSTNALLGYSLSIEDTDGNTNLVHNDPSISSTFTSSFNGPQTSATMSANNWGYSTDGTDFYPIPINGMPHRIGKTEEPSPEDPGYNASQLTFGAKIGDNVASGVYSDTVVLTAYVNGPDDLAYKEDEDGDFTIQTILYDKNTPTYDMQSFSCDDVAAGGVAVVTDTRDGNKYPMKKLKDGNCWMLQNLRITNKTLTPADSNVSSNFVLKASNLNDFKQDETGDELHPNPDINAVYYDDTYGAYYTWYAVTAGTSASIEFSGYTEEELAAIGEEIMQLLEVESYSDMRNKLNEIETILNNDDPDDDATLTENQLLAYQKYNEVNTYYNELEENYMEFDETTSSVCPKGWKLPTIEHMYSLLMQYGALSASSPSTSPYSLLPIVNNNSYAGLIKYEPINAVAPSSQSSMSQHVGNIGTGTAGAVNKLFVGEAGVNWLSSYANDAIIGSGRFDEITPFTFPVQKSASAEFQRASYIPKSNIGKYSYGFTIRCISGSVEPPSLREIFGGTH